MSHRLVVCHVFQDVIAHLSFPVRVNWDGRRKVKITVSRQWQGILCGLCGNYNGDMSDEYMLASTNMLVNSVNEFGESWEYGKTTKDCKVPLPPPPCPLQVKAAHLAFHLS